MCPKRYLLTRLSNNNLEALNAILAHFSISIRTGPSCRNIDAALRFLGDM